MKASRHADRLRHQHCEETVAQALRLVPALLGYRLLRAAIAMSRFVKIIAGLVLLVLLGGAAFIFAWDIPAPTSTKEIVLPDDRFPK